VSRPAATYRSVATRWNATGSRCWCEPLRETCRVYTLGDPMEESPGRLLCDPPAVSPCVLTASHPHPHLCAASVKGRVHASSDIRDSFHPIASPHRDASRPCKFSAVVTAHLVTRFPLASLCKALFRSATIQWHHNAIGQQSLGERAPPRRPTPPQGQGQTGLAQSAAASGA
jgi:hypothetical protein